MLTLYPSTAKPQSIQDTAVVYLDQLLTPELFVTLLFVTLNGYFITNLLALHICLPLPSAILCMPGAFIH